MLLKTKHKHYTIKANMNKLIIIFIVIVTLTILATCELINKQPETCEWEGFQGKCVPAKKCLTTLDKRGAKPPNCEKKGIKSKNICCTDCELVNDTSNFIISPSSGVFWKDGRKARDACLEYLKDLPHICKQEGFYAGIARSVNSEKKCHGYSIWGIGGAPPPNSDPPRENPYEALMGFGHDLESAMWVTAGAIISDKFIVTSAHGHTTTTGRIPLKYAALGVKNRKSDKASWQIREVKRIYQHPDYKTEETPRYNDIALLELKTPITFNEDVLPACLPEPAEDFNISNAKFSSWKDKNSNFLDFIDTTNIITVQELTATECDIKITEAEASWAAVAYHAFLPQEIESDSQLCYGNTNTCLNIIGGPLVVTTQYSRCMNTVIGVSAYGDQCGPTVFTKVKHYTAWIESIVWP